MPAPPIKFPYTMNKWTAKIRASVLENPFAWILFALVLIAEYNNYKKGVLIDHICELSGPHDVASGHPSNDKEELDNICINRQSDD